jgi:hypothetical protein
VQAIDAGIVHRDGQSAQGLQSVLDKTARFSRYRKISLHQCVAIARK